MAENEHEQEIGVEQARKVLGRLVDNAAVRGITTFLTRHGRRHAAIVPVDVARKAFDEEWEHWSTRTGLNVLNAIDEYHLAELARVRKKLAGFGLTEDQINETLATAEYGSVEGSVSGSIEGVTRDSIHDAIWDAARGPKGGVRAAADEEMFRRAQERVERYPEV